MLEIEEGLIARIASGDREAFAELYRLTDRTVYAFALSLLKDREEAQDVMHDAYLNIYSAAGTYRPMGKPLAWILTIVKNLARMKLRKRGRELAMEDVEDPSEAAATAMAGRPGRPAEGAVEDALVLKAALAALNEDERQIVLLHAASGLKHREIAELLGLPLSTVLSKYNRALPKLRKYLEGGDQA